MRIRPSTSFPHPILAVSTGDYGERSFQFELMVQEDPGTGQAILSGTMSLDDPEILELLARDQAVSGLMVTCQETYLDSFVPRELGDLTLDLSGGQIRGLVYVRGVVIATRDNLKLSSESISPEFSAEAKLVTAGDVIAHTEELRFEAGLEKLAPLESIFRLKLHDDVAEGVFTVDLDSESIDILVAPELHKFLSLLRGQEWKDTLLSSLFLPVLMSVLEAMREEDSYVEKRWHSIMSARCNAEGIDVKHADLAEAAQRLLDSPLGSLQRVFERASA